MQFKRFHWLSHHSISNYNMTFKYDKRTRFFKLSFGSRFLYFEDVFNKAFIPFGLDEYAMVIAN